MRCIKYLIFSLFFFIIFTFNVSAEVCDSDDIARLKEIANNVSTSYYYNEEDEEIGNYGQHTIVVSGITDEIYGKIFLDDGEENFHYDDDNLGSIEVDVGSGPKTLNVYSEKCDEVLLKKIKIDIPYYNIYSTYEECDNISGDDLEVCSKFLDKEITESVFRNAIKKYNKNHDSLLDEPVNFFEEYKYVIVGILSVLILTIVILVVGKIKSKNELN